MYCKNCGINIYESNFCHACGTASEATTTSANNPPLAHERVNISKRESLVDSFAEYASIYSGTRADYDRLVAMQDYISTTSARMLRRRSIFWSIVCFLPALLMISLIFDGDSKATLQMMIIPILMFSLPLIIVIISRINKKAKIERYKRETGVIIGRLHDHYNSVNNNLVAFEYADPYTLQSIIELFRTGRADTLKEAVNILNEEKFQEDLLNIQGEVYRMAVSTKGAAKAAAVRLQ